MLTIGKLRHRVEIQSNQPTAQDEHGNPVDKWLTQATVWAEVIPQSGNESLQGEKVTAETTHLVRIRYRKTMNPVKRLKYGTRLFDVNGVVNEDERNRVLTLSCTELASVSV